jgi:hypothetical protein
MFTRIVTRRNLTPPPPDAGGDKHGQRRQSGGARREASDRVRLYGVGGEVEGWTLNLSRGGVRIIVEERVELGNEYDISIGDDEHIRRPCRVVWVQDEPDGQIAGVQFLDTNTGSVPPPGTIPPSASGASNVPSGG